MFDKHEPDVESEKYVVTRQFYKGFNIAFHLRGIESSPIEDC